MKPKHFNEALLDTLDAYFSRIDKSLVRDSFVWTMQSGDLIWFVEMDHDPVANIFYPPGISFAPASWVKEDFSNTKRAPAVLLSQLLDLDELDFAVDYDKLPGQPIDSVFESGLYGPNVEYRRLKAPNYYDIDDRKRDLDTFFSALKSQLQELTLSLIHI